MIARDKFEGDVYSLLFPGGLIPLSCKSKLHRIDSKISEIYGLVNGKELNPPKNRGIRDPDESAKLTSRIIELYEGQKILSWKDIANELNNVISADAVRCRYLDAKALQAKSLRTSPDLTEHTIQEISPELNNKQIQEEKTESAEVPTIRNSRMVEEIKGVLLDATDAEPNKKVTLPKAESKREHNLTPSQRGCLIGPKIPHSEDQFIFEEKESGKTFGEIRKTLVQRGFDCSANDVSQRYYTDLKKRMAATAKVEGGKTAENVAPEEPRSPSPPGVEGAQELAREAIGPTRGTPEVKAEAEKEKPAPKSISRAELDAKIWEMHTKEKLTEEEISDRLYAEGLFYSEKSVHIRLISQGANL